MAISPYRHHPTDAKLCAGYLSELATKALLAEVRLTPKPGLVDRRSSGAHQDLSLELMERSALSLTDTFYQLALVSWQRPSDVSLRLEIGRIGRQGEREMMQATNGVNTHRGAIWALGLLVSAGAMHDDMWEKPAELTQIASQIARIDDPLQPQQFSKGKKASHRYRIPGAKEQAQQGFPTVINHGLAELRFSRTRGDSEEHAQVNALLAMMVDLTDTCVLSRGGWSALETMRQGARQVLACGGIGTQLGMAQYQKLETEMMKLYISPGGAADLLSATLLLDWLSQSTN